MRDFVYGDDVLVEAFKDGDYYPFACVEKVKVRMKSEQVETTVPDSGAWKDILPTGRNEWDVTMSGVTVLRDLVDILWFSWETLLYQLRMEGLQLRINFKDRNGFEKFVVGKAYIEESQIDGTSGDFSRWDLQMNGSGPLDVEGITEPVQNPNVTRIEWIATGAEPNEVQDNRLIGLAKANILLVSLEGDDKFFVITAGLPTDRQVLLDNAAGKLKFKNNFEPGFYIWCQILNA